MDLDVTLVTAENDSLFRQRLLRAVDERLAIPATNPSPSFSKSLVDAIPLADVVEAIGVFESLIAKFDMYFCIKGGGLYGDESMKRLARWVVDGGTPEARDLLKVLRDRPNIIIWPLATAGVTPEYLSTCIEAGITDSEAIARGYADGIAVEFLVSLHA